MIFPKKIHIAHAIPHWFCALFCAIVLLGGPFTATAQPKSSAGQHQPRHAVQTRQKFLLDKTVYVTSDFEHSNTAAELAQWLRSKGVAASNALNKARNRIILQKVHSIEGASGSDAWQITIKSRRITVSFTSENSLQHALRTLQDRIVKDANGVQSQLTTTEPSSMPPPACEASATSKPLSNGSAAARKRSTSYWSTTTIGAWRAPRSK